MRKILYSFLTGSSLVVLIEFRDELPMTLTQILLLLVITLLGHLLEKFMTRPMFSINPRHRSHEESYKGRPIHLFDTVLPKIFPNKIEDLNIGAVKFMIEDEMRKGYKHIATAAISFKQLLIESRFGSEGIEDLRVTKKMEAKLIAEDKFQTTTLSTPIQIVMDDDITIWNWELIPLKSGEGSLTLLVSASVSVEGIGSEMIDIYTGKRVVKIKENIKFTINKFLLANWQWIVGLVGGSGVTFSILKALGTSK